MGGLVTFVALLCGAICCGAATISVTWTPKFADSNKGLIDCGAKSIHIEEVKWVTGNCTATATDFYRTYCEGRNICNLKTITPKKFGCHREGKPTLYYTATCLEVPVFQHVTVKEGGDQRIDCGADQVIHIRSAKYTGKDCFYNVHVPVEGLCGRKHTCDLNPTLYNQSTLFTYDNYYGTKCPGNDNVLDVDYFCQPANENPEFFLVTPANEEITLTCPADQKIFVKRAFYGYGDAQDDVTITVRGICSSQNGNRCTYKPFIPEFSDFDGNWDFNTVYFYCSNDLTENFTQYTYTAEGQNVQLNCPTGRILDIENAYYGVGGFQADVSVVVKSQCQNKGDCSFLPGYDMFLDPRGGPKHLTVGYNCRERQYNDLTYITVNHDSLGMIDCFDQFIYIVEAFYGTGYIQEDVTANGIWDRCDSRWPEPLRNSYCVFGARDIYFGNVGPAGKLTVGYYCSPHPHNDVTNRRTRQYLYGAGDSRDTSYQTFQ